MGIEITSVPANIYNSSSQNPIFAYHSAQNSITVKVIIYVWGKITA